jgi:outer membrane protein TolC
MSSEIGEQLIDIGVYIDTALANRPDLKQYRETLLAAEYTLYYKWGAFSPTIGSSAGYNYTLNKTDTNMRYGNTFQGSPDNYSSSTRSRAYNWGVNANWLIFDGIQRYEQVREAQALVAQNQYEMANKWINVVQEVRAAYDNYVQNTKQAILFKKTLSLVTKQRELVEEEYKAGNVELTRLNEAQNAVVKADTDLVSALINVQNAKAQLDSATNTK